MRRSLARLVSVSALAIATASFAGAASAGGGNGGDHGYSGGSSGDSQKHDSSGWKSQDDSKGGYVAPAQTKTNDGGSAEADHTSYDKASEQKSYRKSDEGEHTSSEKSSEQKSYDVKKSHVKKSYDVKSSEKSYDKSGSEGDHHSSDTSSEQKSYDVKKSFEHKSFGKSDDDHSYSKSKVKSLDHKSGVKAEVKSFAKADRKVTICHLTGSGYVAITVDKHALKHGHTAAKGDIIPMAAGGCPTVASAAAGSLACSSGKDHEHDHGKRDDHDHHGCGVEPQLKTLGAHEQKTLIAKCGETSVTIAGGVLRKDEHGKYVLIHSSRHSGRQSGHYKGKHGDDIVLADKQVLVSNGAACGAVQGTQQTSVCAPVTTTKQVDVQVVDGVWHKTGSEKHPYVLIHPSKHSAHWSGKHEDDIANVVTVTKTILVTTTPESCTASTPATTTTTTVATTTTATTTTEAAAVAPATSETPTVQVQAATMSQTVPGALPATQGAATPVAVETPQGGVAGAQATLNRPKAGNGGVLGTVGNVAGASLPFTGFPLWVAVLLAVALIGAGLMLRRRGPHSPRL
jgi:hypothetical protein